MFAKKSLKIMKGKSDVLNRKRRTMTRRQNTTRQIKVHKTLHRKQKI